MFESAELGHQIDKEVYKAAEADLRQTLLATQYQLVERADFPVIILLGGVPSAGKGEMANLLLEWMDPRHITTHAFGPKTDEERSRPPMWRFWRSLPPKGKMAILFGGWYTGPMWQYHNQHETLTFEHEIERIAQFEKMLADEGVLLIKFWLHLSQPALKKRIKKLAADPLTAWRVTEEDKDFLRDYEDNIKASRQMLMHTNLPEAPWRVVESTDSCYRSLTVGQQIQEAINHHMERISVKQNRVETAPIMPPVDNLRLLDKLVLDHKLSKDKYKRELETLQGRLNQLSRDPDFRKIAVVVLFEGMDAAGKGGSIRRITAALDARQYRIVPIAAPTEEERAQPYLWRFWRHVPTLGQITIFDRSWYGRVLVERIEGFAARADWMRAYNEINEFEAQLQDAQTIVVKFWLAISNEEQLCRFKEREQTEWKRFKITEEDWRNREKWDNYIVAASDMIERTSTPRAPWHLVPANNKYYARIQILEALCASIEAQLKQQKK